VWLAVSFLEAGCGQHVEGEVDGVGEREDVPFTTTVFAAHLRTRRLPLFSFTWF